MAGKREIGENRLVSASYPSIKILEMGPDALQQPANLYWHVLRAPITCRAP